MRKLDYDPTAVDKYPDLLAFPEQLVVFHVSDVFKSSFCQLAGFFESAGCFAGVLIRFKVD